MKAISILKIVTVFALLACSYCISAQADSTRLRNWDIVPLISSSPEMGLLLGVNPVFSFTTNASDSTLQRSFISAELFGTFRRQFGVSSRGNLFFDSNRYQLEFGLNTTLNQWRYYGIGNEIDLDQYDIYRFRSLSTDVVLLRKVISRIYAGLGYRYNYQLLPNPEDNELLMSDNPIGFDGFTASGAVAVLRWDGRDHILNAYKGSYLDLRTEQYSTGLGSEYPFEVFIADFRQYVSLSPDSYHVLAFQVLHRAAFGQVPFAELSMLGGSTINRGYFAGAFRDRNIVSAQTEYRRMINRAWGGVVFASMGNVMDSYNALQLEETKVAAGLGLRYAILPQHRINLRLDFAWGKDSQGIYFGISEAF